MDMIKQVVFDVRGTNVNNRILLEKITIRDKTCPWIIPNGSPFFGEELLVTIYDSVGAELQLGTDYWFEGEFVPFCQVTGRSICSFIKLSERVRNNNAFVTTTYQSIGAWWVPRNDLEEWYQEITKGKIPIPWEKVFNVPPELPPEFHKHSAITEVGDWFELTFIFATMANIYRTRDFNAFENADDVIRDSFEQLKNVKAAQLARIDAHDSNYYAPHAPTKANILLGNLDNFATATLADDQAGIASNLFSTSQGVLAVAETYEQDTSAAMQSGVMPLSYFGGENFVPPSISGSFEGLGSLNEVTGICLESNGQLAYLTNHFDGRVTGLYFTIVDDYNKQNPKIAYTNFKYEPPSLQNIGVTPSRIIAGSGNQAIMVGVNETNNWYVSLTGGSFNPTTHEYVKSDITDVLTMVGEAVWKTHPLVTLLYTEEYLLLFVPVGEAPNERFSFFRVKVSDIRNKVPVKWELLTINYTDFDGVVHSNASYLQLCAPIRDGSNQITRLGPWSFRQPPTTFFRSGRAHAWTSKITGYPGSYYFHTLYGCAAFRNGAIASLIMAMGFVINPTTGTFLTLTNPYPQSIGFSDATEAERASYINAHYAAFLYAVGASQWATGMFLPTGEFVTTYGPSGNSFPLFMQYTHFNGLDTIERVLAQNLDQQVIGGQNNIIDTPQIANTPLRSGTFPSSLGYEPDGETYMAVNQENNVRAMFFRKLYGNYAIRPNVSNIDLGSVYSRPLTNDVYLTNLRNQDGVITVTGGSVELTAWSLDCGNSAYSMFGWSSTQGGLSIPTNPSFHAPAGNNFVLSFPLTHTKTLNTVDRTATYEGTTFCGIRQNIIDKVRTLIPPPYNGTTPHWCFTVNFLNSASGALFDSLNVGVLSVMYYDTVNARIRSVLALIVPIIEAPGGDHPTASLMTDFAIQYLSSDMRQSEGADLNVLGFVHCADFTKMKPSLSIYRAGTILKAILVNAFTVANTDATGGRAVTVFDINRTTGGIENVAAIGLQSGWSSSDLLAMIPQLGMTDLALTYNDPEFVNVPFPAPNPYGHTGGAASIFTKTTTGPQYYLTMSAYPETGWVIFFQDGIRLMIQGTSYLTPGGTIDLRDLDGDPRNKVFYIYVTVEDSLPKYLLSTVELRRGSAMMLVGKATTSETQIVTIERYQPFVIGDFQLSYTREGGIIPVSTGFPQDEGVFRFLSMSELLP